MVKMGGHSGLPLACRRLRAHMSNSIPLPCRRPYTSWFLPLSPGTTPSHWGHTSGCEGSGPSNRLLLPPRWQLASPSQLRGRPRCRRRRLRGGPGRQRAAPAPLGGVAPQRRPGTSWLLRVGSLFGGVAPTAGRAPPGCSASAPVLAGFSPTSGWAPSCSGPVASTGRTSPTSVESSSPPW